MTILSLPLAIYALWVYFLACMALERARNEGRLSKPALALGLCVLWPGYLLDVAVNVTVCTVVFLELPREWTVSTRVSRLEEGDGYRKAVAVWVCQNLLNPFDPSGKHCDH